MENEANRIRIQLRLTRDQKQVIVQAAAARGQTLSDFSAQALTLAAQRVILNAHLGSPVPPALQ